MRPLLISAPIIPKSPYCAWAFSNSLISNPSIKVLKSKVAMLIQGSCVRSKPYTHPTNLEGKYALAWRGYHSQSFAPSKRTLDQAECGWIEEAKRKE